MIETIVLFIGTFALYLHTGAPQLAPYRDAGEMVSLLSTLGVAHPPGYPLYTLLGRIFLYIPLGNLMFRANAFSALCAAATIVVLYITLQAWIKKTPAFLAVLFLAFSNPFWDLATVSEMYALGMVAFATLLLVTFRLKNPVLFAFLMSLTLGVRMDMLLLVPVFVAWYAWNGARREIAWMIPFFAIGASVFLYLMVRSRTDPLLDWANPDNLLAVLNSARRKNYSGTLDLLSLSYAAGENFTINLRLYGQHVVDSFGWWGALFAAVGTGVLLKKNIRVGMFFFTIFLMTGPIFLYLANMPPNPHAVAIVEASYLVPDVMVALFIAWGIDFMCRPGAGAGPGDVTANGRFADLNIIVKRYACAGATALLLTLNLVHGFHRASKRHNLFARDYVENVFRSIPKNGVAVFHKDVQIFSLWAAQLVDHRRPDVALVPTGLSASSWYWDMKRRWKTAPSPEISLKDSFGWKQLASEVSSRAFVAGYDVELPQATGLSPRPSGLLMRLDTSDYAVSNALHDICLYRGEYKYGETPDFFSTDLIGDTARANNQMGFYLMQNGNPQKADWYFQRAETLDATFARTTSDRAYLAFSLGQLPKAYELFASAARKADRSIQLTMDYKSLPEVVESYRNEAAIINTQWGAVSERLGRIEEARQLYLRALSIHEVAQAHYNLAVSYWGKDWQQVIVHLHRALEINPQMAEARTFLTKALAVVGKH